VGPSHWTGAGPEFNLDWGGRRWTLKVDAARPGLHSKSDDSTIIELLSLQGLAQAGRFDSEAFNLGTLICFERWRERVQATFAPPGWGGLLARAAWGPDSRHEAIDLEIQVNASSVGELRAIEVWVSSGIAVPGGTRLIAPVTCVEARDPRSAALSYDGREPAVTLRGLTTLPLPESAQFDRRPRVLSPPGGEPGVSYVELAQPNDVSRQVTTEHLEAGATKAVMLSTRYCLFGHDLEKGVVLRARLRGIWLQSETPEDDALARNADFLREPLPLGP
jgi:hypothetical protein